MTIILHCSISWLPFQHETHWVSCAHTCVLWLPAGVPLPLRTLCVPPLTLIKPCRAGLGSRVRLLLPWKALAPGIKTWENGDYAPMEGEKKFPFIPTKKYFICNVGSENWRFISELSFFHWSPFASDIVTFTILAFEFGVIGWLQPDCLSLCLVHLYIWIENFFHFFKRKLAVMSYGGFSANTEGPELISYNSV